MAGRVLRDSKGRYAGSTRGWGRGRSRGGGRGGGKSVRKKGSGVPFSRPAAAMAAIKRGASVGTPLAKEAVSSRSPSAMSTAAKASSRIAQVTYKKARAGRL